MNLDHHPCFNDKARHRFGRVHLPVAPRCNIQCRFCNRKFDCVNESRPGVTSGILTPAQAAHYLDKVVRQRPEISVVGIAGPGDPFANPEETLDTLRMVRHNYPDMLLCVASNGLNVSPYVEDLARLKVSHVTITVNAVDVAVGEKIYAWVRHGKRVIRADKGAALLMENQLDAIQRLKSAGVTVKVNTIVIPTVNDHHVEAVAQKVAGLGADILNCVAYYPNEGAAFSDIPEPPAEMMKRIRKTAGSYLPQMHHCTRCRADAAGLLGEAMSESLMNELKSCEKMTISSAGPGPLPVSEPDRPHVAVASMEGVLVNQHLGEATRLMIYKENGSGLPALVQERKTPEPGGGDARWRAMAHLLSDCSTLLVSGVGEKPKAALEAEGIRVLEVEGLIEDAVSAAFRGTGLKHLIKRKKTACGAVCMGDGGGCG